MSIGEALAEARRRAGLTVTQVSDQTRIRETVITGIESNDYSACGGDLYVRGYIRSIAQAVGADPEPLIREYDTAQPGPQAITDDSTEPVTFTRTGEWLWRAWFVVVALVAVGLWVVAFHSFAGSRHAVTAAPSARAHPVAPRPAGHSTQVPSAPAPNTPGAVRMLTPAGAAAFNPSGIGQGDHSDLAHLAIDGNPATAWHTDWYTTAHFGNLYPGTGLLVDMGRPTTITAARITLGRAHGAGFQLRVGAAPALADLPPVARAAGAGGVVHLRLSTPAHGRYVLVWFTSLPPDPAGTFQASVYDLRLEGPA
ncbi:MAG: helix-turn-helix domain-containing protein [Micromonosporaceae bacterium]